MSDDLLDGDSPFRPELTDQGDHLDFRFVHRGPSVPDVKLYLGFLDETGMARAGDGADLGDIARDLRVVLYDHERVDASSIEADYANPLGSDARFALFLSWWVEGTLHAVGAIRTVDGIRIVLDSAEAVRVLESTGMYVEPAPAAEGGEPLFFTRLSVSGFRGFATEGVVRFAQPDGREGSGLTVLVGANNSGKSTFLEALYAIARVRQQTEVEFAQPRRHRDTDSVAISIRRSDGRELAVRSIRPGGSQAMGTWLPEGATPTRFDIHITPSRRNFTPYFSSTGIADRDWGFMQSELSRTQPRDQFVGRLRKVDREPAARKEFDRLLTEIVGYPLNWTIDEIAPNQQFLKLIESDGAWHTSEGLGDGLVSLLFIVDALYDSEPGSLIAIDEPELSLHPQLVRRLGRILAHYAADRQILVATHSPLLLEWDDISHGAAVVRVHKTGGRSQVGQASREALDAVSGHLRNLHNPHILGSVAREAFFLEDGVILVEGQDDVVFLPRVLADLGLPPVDNLFGWGAGGATNMPAFAALFLELGFTRIAAVLDDDGRPETNRAFDALESMGPAVLVRRIPAPDIRYKAATATKGEVVGLVDRDNVHVRSGLRGTATAVLREVIRHVQRPESPGAVV